MAERQAMWVLDGGTGRELKRIGAPFQQPEWSALALLQAPHFVTRVHESYVAAGARVITTNSYAVVPFHIGEERFAQQGATLAALAGRLAREVADRTPGKVQVAGSLPPICGSYRAEWFDADFARPILQSLVTALRSYVDHWQAETLSSINEARLVREVIGQDGLPLWISYTLDDQAAAGDPRLRSGERVSDAVAVALELGAAAILFNCSQPEVMADAVDATMAALVSSPQAHAASVRIGVYANAFPPQGSEAEANSTLHEIRKVLTPEGYLAFAQQWAKRGASIIGGCCGIGPEHIAALSARLTS